MSLYSRNTLSCKHTTPLFFTLGITISLSIGIVAQALAQTNYTKLGQELEIMDSVISTALKQVSEQAIIKAQTLQTTYLAGQGVVYHLSVGANNWYPRHESLNALASISMPSMPPMPPVSEIFNSVEQEEIETGFDSFDDASEQADNESYNKLRDAKNSVRDLAWKLRNYEREVEDLSFESLRAEAKRKEEIESRLNLLKKQNEAVIKEKQKLMAMAEKIVLKKKQKRAEQEAAMKKANQAFLTVFEQSIADSLCRFGAGLRALPQHEHITFVLDNFTSNENNQYRDKIYVFTAADVKRCVQEKIKTSDLLSSAVVYDF